MSSRNDLRFLLVLCMFAVPGCGAKSSVDLSPAAKPAAVTSSTAVELPVAKTTSPDVDLPADPAQQDKVLPSFAVPVPEPVASPPVVPAPKAPVKPTAEQIAKWGIAEYEPLQLLVCNDGFADSAIQSAAVSPDGKQYVLGGAKLTLWNTKDVQPIVELLAKYNSDEVERPIRSVAISPDGKWIAAGDQKGTVRIWTISDQREVIAIKAHQGHLTSLAFSPNSKQLATTSYSGEVHLWELPEGKKLKTVKMDEQEITRLVFLSDSLLASAGSAANIWNVETGRKETVLTTKYVRGPALALSIDRRLLAFNDHDSTVQLWDVENSQLTGSTLRGAGADLIAFSQDGKWIATYSGDSLVRIWDASTHSVVQVIDADGDQTAALEWLPDSNSLLIASEQGRVRIWGQSNAAETIGTQPIALPELSSTAAGPHRSLSSAQFQKVIDIRSFPRLPGAVVQWSSYGMCAYSVRASQTEAEQFYRYLLEKSGWMEAAPTVGSQPGLIFRNDGCLLNVSFTPTTIGPPGSEPGLQVSLHFAGNYDVRWLPKISEADSKSAYSSFSLVSYRTRAELIDVEVALLKQFHDAGWTPYSRLASSSSEDPKSRSFSMVQGGSVLTVSIGYPADSTQELFVQTNVSVSNKSLPIPPDAGWIEFDSSTDLQLVASTAMDLQQTTEFFDLQMAAEGWSPREAGRRIVDDKGWLPYIRGQQDVFIRLTALEQGGTRIVVGDAQRSSWQLQKPAVANEKTDKPAIEAADLALPNGSKGVMFDVDQKQIKFEVDDTTPPKLGEKFIEQMESLKWKREAAGVSSDEYVFLTFSKAKAEIQIRIRADGKKSTAAISGDGLLWTKPLPTPPVRISYETWLRRNHKDANLDQLDEFAAEMRKIPAAEKTK